MEVNYLGLHKPKGLVHAIIYNYDNFANNYDNFANIFFILLAFARLRAESRVVLLTQQFNEVWFSLSSCNHMHLHFSNVIQRKSD